MGKIEQIQTILGVKADGIWGKKSKAALDALLLNSSFLTPTSAAAVRWPLEKDAAKFYGANDGGAKWETANLVYITPPYQMWIDGQAITRIRCHRLVAASLLRILTKIRGHYGTQEAIEAVGLDAYDGCYNYRKVRGAAAKLSMHAYGAAIDFDAAGNPLGSSRGRMPAAVVAIFRSEGWRWGGDYKGRKDPMHFEACR